MATTTVLYVGWMVVDEFLVCGALFSGRRAVDLAVLAHMNNLIEGGSGGE